MGMRGQILKIKTSGSLCALRFFSPLPWCELSGRCFKLTERAAQDGRVTRRKAPGTVTLTCVARDSAGSLPVSAGTVLRLEGPVAPKPNLNMLGWWIDFFLNTLDSELQQSCLKSL